MNKIINFKHLFFSCGQKTSFFFLFFFYGLMSHAQVFHPTGGYEDNGFITNIGACMVNTCNSKYYDDGGPNNDYSNSIGFQSGPNTGLGVSQSICPTDPNTCIRIRFNSFDLNTTDDLTIIDGPSGGEPIATGTGNSLVGETFISNDPSGCLSFYFYTNSSGTADGWDADIDCVNCAVASSAIVNFDCTLVQPVCDETEPLLGNSIGPGFISESCEANSCIITESYSNWYVFTIAQGGSLGLNLVPNPLTADYDFALFRPINNDDPCGTLGSALRCSYSFDEGATGMRPSANTDSEGFGGGSWVNDINTSPGETYVLLISQKHIDPSSFTLNWTGAATIASPEAKVTLFGENEPIDQEVKVCIGDFVELEAELFPGSEYLWTLPDGSTVQTPWPLLDGFYVSATDLGEYSLDYTVSNGCAGGTKVFDLVNDNLETPTPLPVPPICGSGVPDLEVNPCGAGAVISWYDAEVGGNQIASGAHPNPNFIGNNIPTITQTTTFYVSCQAGQCPGPRVAVEAVVTSGATPPVVTSPINYCIGDASSVLSAAGMNLTWYPSENSNIGSSDAPTPSTLVAGTQSFWVSQTDGCEGARSEIEVIITAPPNIMGTPTVNDATCGSNDGSISVTATGGVAPLSYSINGGAFVVGNTFNNLPSGNHTVIVRDENRCEVSTGVINVGEANGPSISINSSTDASCGNNNGSISASITGGAVPYSFSINGGTYVTEAVFLVQIQSLLSGNYIITVRDGNLCEESSASITIGNSTAPVIDNTVPSSTTCGNNNGTITVSATGGTPPYRYSVDGVIFSVVNPITGLSAGDYPVTVRDFNDCEVQSATMITVGTTSDPSISGTTTVTEKCGQGNGSITINATGGTAPYNYSINGGAFQANNSFAGLSSGNYVITVRDVNMCEVESSSINVASVNASTITAVAPTQTACNNNTGTVTVTATGASPFVYSINNGPFQNSNVFNDLSMSSYTVTIRDNNGCTTTAAAVSVTEFSSPTISSTIPSETACSNNTGSIAVVANGNGPFEYSIDGLNFQNNSTLGTLAEGSYRVTIRDANGCTAESNSISILEVAGPTVSGVSATETACGGSTGSLDVTAVGSAPLAYSLDGINFQASNLFTGLAASSYSVIVRDNNGCTTTAIPSSVGDANGPSVTNVTSAASRCNADDGIINVTASGGSGVLEYSIDGVSFQGSDAFANLSPGNYTITVRDENNCIDTEVEVVMNESNPVIDQIDLQDASCGVTNGSIEISASGGTGNLVYSIDGLSFQVSNIFPNLGAASYTITVRDGNNCEEASSLQMINNVASPIIDNTDITLATCGVDNGIIEVSATGGTGLLEYSLDGINFQTNNRFQNLSSGNYTVTIRDENNCTETTGVLNLADASSPSIVDVAPTPATCGEENGSIIITAIAGGMGNLEYSTDGITYQSSEEFSELSFGNYDVFVRDENQCVVSEFNIEVADASSPVINNIDNEGATCGESNGRIEVMATGGTGLLAYSLDGVNFQNENEFIDLSSGVYNLVIRDANNCEERSSITISNTAGPSIDDTQLSVATCGESNGRIEVTATGGSGLLEYSIDGINFQSTNEFTDLAAANYTITIRDANACTAELTNVDLSSADTPVIDNIVITESTCGAENGSISVVATGGVGAIVYSIDGVNFQNEHEFTNLPAADYRVTIKDANDCSVSSLSMNLGNMAGPQLSQVDANQATCGQSNGSISVVGSGGTGLLEYSLDGITYQTIGDFNNLSPGVFTIRIRDENDCVFSSNPISVADPDGPVVDQATATPATCGIANGTINATATGGVGTLEYSIDRLNYQLSGAFVDLVAGSYTVTIRDENNCEIDFAAIMVLDASSPVIDLITTNQSSCGESNGSIEVNAVGGTGLLEYSIDGINFQVSNTFEDLSSGNYTVIIRDENQCEDRSNSLSLMDASSPIIEDVSIVASTCEEANGRINITASGGTGRLEYSLDNINFQAINEFNNLGSGDYTVFVKDQNDCIIPSNTVSVAAQPSPSITNVGSTAPSCGSTDGSISIESTGGTGLLEYSIDGGLNFQTTNIFTDLGSSNYEIQIRDENNCASTQSFSLNELGGPTIDNIIDAAPLCGASDGRISIIATGGTGLLEYSIDGGMSFQSENDFTGLENADYDIVVQDGGGCSTNQAIALAGPARLNFSCSMTKEASDDINEDGEAQFAISGGTAPYVVSWTGVNTGSLNIPITGEASLGNLKGGVYQINIEDANGCTQSCELNITFPLCTRTLTASISGNVSICQGEAAMITFNFDGGSTYDIRYVNDLNEVFNLEGIVDGHTVSVSPSRSTVYSLVGALPVNIPCEVILSESVVNIAVSELDLETAVTSDYKGVAVSCNGGTDGSAEVSVKKGLIPFSYEWSNGSTSEKIENVTAGKYLVTVSDGASCSRVDSIELVAPLEMQVNLSSRNPDCYEEEFGSILLEEISGGTSPYTISVAQEEYRGLNNFPQSLPLIPVGDFEVIIRDENGCEVKEEIELNRATERIIELGQSIRIREGEGVELRPEVNFSVSRVEWGIDSTLSCTDCMNPIASPISSQKYTVVVFDDLGCFVSDAITVLVEKQREVLVPSGFSPNGDNNNDVLYVHAGSVVEEIASFQIYSRWGELVFSKENFPANDPIYGWDGRFARKGVATNTIGDGNGKQLNAGVFIYQIKAKFMDGLTKTFSGEVTLVR